MEQVAERDGMAAEEDRRISDAISATVMRERSRLLNFIRSRVPDHGDAEDILQDVFYELVEAYRLMKPIEQVGAWLFRVARNRITDWGRKKKPESLMEHQEDGEGGQLTLDDLLPSPEGGPDALFLRQLVMDELEDALDHLPQEQRAVFIAHELENRSFKDLASESGLSVNTLLSRKRYAVLYLRERLRAIYDDLREK